MVWGVLKSLAREVSPPGRESPRCGSSGGRWRLRLVRVLRRRRRRSLRSFSLLFPVLTGRLIVPLWTHSRCVRLQNPAVSGVFLTRRRAILS